MDKNRKQIKRAFLVYQAGIANVFEVECFNLANFGRDAKRLLQSDFRACEWFAQGLDSAGVTVRVAGCNQAGDITKAKWTQNMDELPFSDRFSYPKGWLK